MTAVSKKIRAAVVGYGNIGKYALQALEAAPDFEVAGIVRRQGAENCPEELAHYAVVKDIRELNDVDVAILATPTRSVEAYAKDILALGIHTVDSFDIHTQIVDLRRSLDAVAKEHGTVSIISAGWDPVPIRWYVRCFRPLLPKVSLTRTSVRVCRWDTP